MIILLSLLFFALLHNEKKNKIFSASFVRVLLSSQPLFCRVCANCFTAEFSLYICSTLKSHSGGDYANCFLQWNRSLLWFLLSSFSCVFFFDFKSNSLILYSSFLTCLGQSHHNYYSLCFLVERCFVRSKCELKQNNHLCMSSSLIQHWQKVEYNFIFLALYLHLRNPTNTALFSMCSLSVEFFVDFLFEFVFLWQILVVSITFSVVSYFLFLSLLSHTCNRSFLLYLLVQWIQIGVAPRDSKKTITTATKVGSTKNKKAHNILYVWRLT